MTGTMPKKKAADLSKKLRGWREAKGLTQTEAAAKVGVTQRTWAMWEAGRAPSEPLRILLLALLAGKLD